MNWTIRKWKEVYEKRKDKDNLMYKGIYYACENYYGSVAEGPGLDNNKW